MQEIITIYDFVLLPLYLFIFYLIVRRKSKKYAALGLKKYFILAFWLRMAGAIGYSLLIQYYYGYGDTFGFYEGGNIISKMIKEDISGIKYLFMPADDIVAAAKLLGFNEDIPVSMPNDSNVFVMKLSAVLSFFTFNKYLLIAVCFGFISFIGIWKLFFVFYKMNKEKQVNWLAFFVLFLPSLWFWGSGLLKEPICIAALGIAVYIYHKNFIEKRFFKRDIVMLILMMFILTIVKSYITIILIISLLIILIFNLMAKIKIIPLRIFAFLIIIVLTSAIMFSIDATMYIDYFIDTSFSQIQQLQKSYEGIQQMEDVSNKGAFLISNMEPSFESIIINSPGVIATCLFRPFIWESNKIIILFASLEALLTLIFTAYIVLKCKLYKFFIYIFTHPFLLFCFIFSILFAMVVGYTTFNFGTLTRYKIIFLPFYFFILIQISRFIKERYET